MFKSKIILAKSSSTVLAKKKGKRFAERMGFDRNIIFYSSPVERSTATVVNILGNSGRIYYYFYYYYGYNVICIYYD